MASQSVIFTNAHSNAPVCSPSRAAMSTGIYPHHSGHYGFKKFKDFVVLKNSETIFKYFKKNGYDSLGAGKITHGGAWNRPEFSKYGPMHEYGPLPYDGKKTTIHPSMPPALKSMGALDANFVPLSDVPKIEKTDDAPGYEGWWNSARKKPFLYENDETRDLLGDEKTADWGIKQLKRREKSKSTKPFFLSLGFIKPHTPLIVPKKYFDMYPLESLELPIIKEDDLKDTPQYEGFKTSRGRKMYNAVTEFYDTPELGLKKYLQAYLACVTFVDDQIGKVMNYLDNSKFKDNTIVILTSDHGYHVGEKQLLWKYTLWTESTRVPLLIRGLNNQHNAGKKVSNPVSLVDLYPTFKDYAGLTADNRKNDMGRALDGFSLKPLVENPSQEYGKPIWKGPRYTITALTSWPQDIFPHKKKFAINSKRWRYIYWEEGQEELYDKDSDPHEWTNLVGQSEYAAVIEEHKEALYHFIPDLKLPMSESHMHKYLKAK